MALIKTFTDGAGVEHVDAYWDYEISVIHFSEDTQIKVMPFASSSARAEGKESIGGKENYRMYFIPRNIVVTALKTADPDFSTWQKLEVYIRDHVQEILKEGLTKEIIAPNGDFVYKDSEGNIIQNPYESFFARCEIVD